MYVHLSVVAKLASNHLVYVQALDLRVIASVMRTGLLLK